MNAALRSAAAELLDPLLDALAEADKQSRLQQA